MQPEEIFIFREVPCQMEQLDNYKVWIFKKIITKICIICHINPFFIMHPVEARGSEALFKQGPPAGAICILYRYCCMKNVIRLLSKVPIVRLLWRGLYTQQGNVCLQIRIQSEVKYSSGINLGVRAINTVVHTINTVLHATNTHDLVFLGVLRAIIGK